MSIFVYPGGLLVLFLSLFYPTSQSSPQEWKTTGKLDCEAFYKTSMDKMVGEQIQFMDKYLKNNEGNYSPDYDFENSVLRYKEKSSGKIVAEIAFIHVGYFDADKSVWHWAWEDGDIDPKRADDYQKVKQYGMQNGCDKLTVAQWLGKEVNAWEMSGAVNHILKGKGAARHYTPSEYNYVVFLEISPMVD